VLTVKNKLASDYQTAPVITGELTVFNSTDMEIWSIEINVTHLDDTAFLLTDSKDTYETENSGN